MYKLCKHYVSSIMIIVLFYIMAKFHIESILSETNDVSILV